MKTIFLLIVTSLWCHNVFAVPINYRAGLEVRQNKFSDDGSAWSDHAELSYALSTSAIFWADSKWNLDTALNIGDRDFDIRTFQGSKVQLHFRGIDLLLGPRYQFHERWAGVLKVGMFFANDKECNPETAACVVANYDGLHDQWVLKRIELEYVFPKNAVAKIFYEWTDQQIAQFYYDPGMGSVFIPRFKNATSVGMAVSYSF